MSKQINSNQKVSTTYKITKTSEQYSSKNNRDSNKVISKQNYIVNNLESSTGNMQQRSTDNQSICTCGKWRTDTHSTFNGTIRTNLKSDENCTCDEGKDMSLCNCYKKYNSKTIKKSGNYNSQHILIQDNNYCTCGERQNNIATKSEKEERIINTNITTNTNINESIKGNQKICICGLGDHEAEMFNTASSMNEHQVETIETKDEEDKEKIEEIKRQKKITKEIIKKQIIQQEKREIITWSDDIYIQIIERLQYLAAEPPELTVQFPNDLMIHRTIDNRPIQVLIPIPENFIQKQTQLEVLSEQRNKEEFCPENVDLLNISNAYSIQVPSFNNLEIENLELFIKSQKSDNLCIDKFENVYLMEKNQFKIENYSWDISSSGPLWSGPLKPIRTNKLGIDEEVKENWNDLVQKENVEKFEVEKINVNHRFNTIELGDNEVILLKATKRVLKDYTKTEESSLTMGGKGFKLRVWEPVPSLAISMTLEREASSKKLQIISDEMLMPPARQRRADWNLVNSASLETSVNYLTKEKILEEQNVNPLTIIEEGLGKNKWKEIVKKQSGIKLAFGRKIKKWDLSISKEINMFFEREIDDLIVNDDYNNIAGPQMRPIVVTVLKVHEEDETSSVTSYDVFQNVIIKKSNLNIEFGNKGAMALKNRIELNSNEMFGNKSNKISASFGDGEFSHFGKKEGFIKLRMEENKQKTKYDQTVKNIVHQTKNLVGNMLGLGGKQKNIEYIREDPDVKNYLKV